ncbi:MAG: hypothetical protein KIT81_10190 [Alphaproteobacteria bacterium]|nr:hypothetical protein [Alphaproteobacteria bacterium]
MISQRLIRSAARLLLALTFIIVIGETALAQGRQVRDAPLGAFFGRWSGNAISESETSIYFQLTARDLDVSIQPAEGGGFRIAWTTVTRQRGDPRNPRIERKSSEITFLPAGRPNVWRQANPADPIEAPYAWAAIRGNTLSVTQIAIGEDGGYELQVYNRTLTGGVMELGFSRFRDGEKQRDAKGRLVKVANQ